MSLFRKKFARIAINLRPKKGPFGGGNQWAAQVSGYLKRCGYEVVYRLDEGVDCVLGTHAGLSGGLNFSYDEVLAAKKKNPKLKCIQRINDNDIRKGTGEMDKMLAAANRAADHTVFVSGWLRDHHAERWFDVSKPHSVILNGADPAVFHPFGNKPWESGRPLRIITHHWSDNVAKGFDFYAELDELIATGKVRDVELWIVGRWPAKIQWKAAKTFPACSGHALAGILRQCHVEITASRFEPGAMHPVEALQCGLPLLYHPDTGGTVELGETFGVMFKESLPSSIEEMKSSYASLRDRVLADAPSGDLMCLNYRRIVQRLICETKW